jgi:hypothetical protein
LATISEFPIFRLEPTIPISFFFAMITPVLLLSNSI